MRIRPQLFLIGILLLDGRLGWQPGLPPTPQAASALDRPALSACTDLANWQCVDTRTGLTLCRANNICVVKVDLNNPTLRPRVVIAPNGNTDWLSTMASNAGALAAINGDYFSGCPDTVPPFNCGEGLTYVDGVDYTDYTGSEWQNRRSLGFNDNYDPNIGWPGEQGGYHRQLLGGGPQVTFGGEYRWRCWYQPYNTEGNCACQDNTVVINDELFGCSANNWWNRPQTFIGFSDDRNTLYLAVSEPGYNKTPHEMHDLLWVLGARYSLKMDGGGSSGMYYNDGGYQFAWNGSRPVANAWAIVYSSPPPPSCNPTADQIALFVDADYGGQCVVKGGGDYPNPGAIGLPNDSISSVKVGSSVKAILCEHDNYGGVCETFPGDDPNLSDNSIGNDRVSSARVEQKCPLTGVPPDYRYCANENSFCSFSGTANVIYGADSCYTLPRSFTNGTMCSNDLFGDPLPGVPKNCYTNASSSQPDLQPYTPPGYDAPVVPASLPGTTTAGPLYAGQGTYFDWHFTNSGGATAAGDFYVELWVDSTRYVRYPCSTFGAGRVGGFDDWLETIPAPGWHTVRLITDPDNTITESDEGNNTWEQPFYWEGSQVYLPFVSR